MALESVINKWNRQQVTDIVADDEWHIRLRDPTLGSTTACAHRFSCGDDFNQNFSIHISDDGSLDYQCWNFDFIADVISPHAGCYHSKVRVTWYGDMIEQLAVKIGDDSMCWWWCWLWWIKSRLSSTQPMVLDLNFANLMWCANRSGVFKHHGKVAGVIRSITHVNDHRGKTALFTGAALFMMYHDSILLHSSLARTW